MTYQYTQNQNKLLLTGTHGQSDVRSNKDINPTCYSKYSTQTIKYGTSLYSSTCVIPITAHLLTVGPAELSTGRMNPRVGSGRVGSRFCRILAGRVGSGQHFGFFSFLLIIS